MKEERRITVLGRNLFGSIPTVTQFVAEAARAAGLDEDSVYHCELSADEACTNIIEHAYNGEAQGDIEITCFIDEGKCTIKIVDSGKGFDPDVIPEPVISNSIEEIEPGGLGLHIMRKVMDEVRFEFTDTTNTLIMVKTGKAEPELEESEASFINVTEDDTGASILTIRGRLDAEKTPELESVLSQLLEAGRYNLIVDMGEVEYISSRGMKEFVAARSVALKNNGCLILVSMNETVYKVFEIVGFTQVFDICEDMRSALARFE